MTQQLDKAEAVIKKNLTLENTDFRHGRYYHQLGVVQAGRKQYVESINSFLKASSNYLSQGAVLKSATIDNNIANIYLALGDHTQSYKYSRKCFDVFRHHPENPNYIGVLGILAICENNNDLLDSSIVHINHGFQILDTTESILGDILFNFAKSEWEFKNGNYQNSVPFAEKSLAISEALNLSQYESMNSILLMSIYNQLEDYSKALQYGLRAKREADLANNLSMHHSITDGLSIAYAGLGRFKEAYFYKKETDSLKTIDRDEKNKSRMDSLLVEYEFVLNENKILNQDITISNQKRKIQKRNTTLVTLIALLLIGVLFVYFRIRLLQNRQERRLAKAINLSEEKERERLYSELHDGLAAELTSLRFEIEQNMTGTEKALTLLKNAHQTTRFIAHNLSSYFIQEKGLVVAMANLVENYNSRNNVTFYTNIDTKLKLRSKVETILYRSTQELMQNAMKHSNASEVNVQILLQDNTLRISVEDDGVGLTSEQIKSSTGLKSLKSRINLIHGVFEIESAKNEGTSAFITLKLN